MALWPLTFEIVITFVLSTFLLYRYGNWNNQNVVTTLSVFVAWFFSFLVIFILPLDISNTTYQQCILKENSSAPATTIPSVVLNTTSSENSSSLFENITIPSLVVTQCKKPWSYAPYNVMTTLWKIVYWTSQFLTWIVLPMMQSYSMAGDFTALKKLRSAFIENAIYYGTFAVIFLIFLVYVVMHTSLDFAKLKVICVTASNTWGLFLLVVLLGYGLVEIPRSCYSTSLYDQTLSYLYFKVAKLSAEKCEAQEKLEDTLDEIQHAYETVVASKSPMKQYVEVILERCPVDWKMQLRNAYMDLNRTQRHNAGAALNEKCFTRIHQTINRAVQTHRRVNFQWNHLITKTIEWEDVAKNSSNPSKMFKPTLSRPVNNDILSKLMERAYTPTVEWYWKCVLRSIVYRYVGYVLFMFSLMVVWSEMTFSIDSPPLSIFAYIFSKAQSCHCYFLIEVFSICCIAYMSVCTYYTVFKIRIFNYYYLAPHHQTDEYSLIFCGMLLCRLTPPLCLNFLKLIHLDYNMTKQEYFKETAFTHIMGHMDFKAIPFIKNGFDIYLPIIMCLFCLATFFQFGSRLLHMMGIEQFIIDDELTTELIREGQELVKREKNKKLRQEDAESNKDRRSNPRPMTLPVEPPNVSHNTHNFSRTSSADSAKMELLNDAEPIDYATWNTSTRDVQNFKSKPQLGIFDDI